MLNIEQRMLAASRDLKPFRSAWCIAWEDPYEMDTPVKITHPAPEMMALLMRGGVMPAVEILLTGTREERNAAPPLGPLSEKEALMWVMKKSIPAHVWGLEHNRPVFRFIPTASLPRDRSLRNAWRLETLLEAA